MTTFSHDVLVFYINLTIAKRPVISIYLFQTKPILLLIYRMLKKIKGFFLKLNTTIYNPKQDFDVTERYLLYQYFVSIVIISMI